MFNVTQYSLPKNSLKLVIGLLFLFFSPAYLLAQSFSVPIKFKIEDGGFEESQILVQRNGTTTQTITGKERLTLELAYNADYIITFVKPGYITKRISINTHTPADRAEQGFEPYTYGVNLFKQYEGVNTVIFNQPVAKIAYSKKVDDFDYDVDYTKSIQSAMKEAEEETQKRAVIAKKQEAEKVAAEKVKTAKELENKKEADKKAAEDAKIKLALELKSKKAEELRIKEEEKLKKELALEEEKKKKNNPVVTGEDKKKQAAVTSGEDKKPIGNPASGEDQKLNKLKPVGDQNEKTKSVVQSGEDKKKPAGYMVSGIDQKPVNETKPISGKDLPDKGAQQIQDGGIIVEEFIEPNRSITKVTVKNEVGRTYTYTKVAYHWGATYYFRNGTLSIPEYLYRLNTRMK